MERVNQLGKDLNNDITNHEPISRIWKDLLQNNKIKAVNVVGTWKKTQISSWLFHIWRDAPSR